METFAERLCLSDELRKQWQSENKKTEIKEGGLIQIAFPYYDNEKDGTEHMWVYVERVRGQTFFGKLMNVPMKATKLRFKAAVVCKRDQVEAYEPPKKYEPKTS
jgi:uncharacterized protein YegJ (DUF2314 family)